MSGPWRSVDTEADPTQYPRQADPDCLHTALRPDGPCPAHGDPGPPWGQQREAT
jgi:hypothetical protein